MKDKKKLILIIIIAVLVIAVAAVLVLIVTSKKETPNKPIEDEPKQEVNTKNEIDRDGKDCTTKGNVCTVFQIGAGIKKEIKVNKNTTETFYMLSNTEDKMSFISEKTYEDILYSENELNFFGPRILLEKTYETTKGWNSLEPIKGKYEDKGKALYYELCDSFDKEVEDYNCGVGKNGIGFKYIEYGDGITLADGFGNILNYGKGDVYARPATLEEFEDLILYADKVKWLENSNSFWLVDSDSQNYSGIMRAAKYVNISDDSTFGFFIDADYVGNKHGYKVVIELNKN